MNIIYKVMALCAVLAIGMILGLVTARQLANDVGKGADTGEDNQPLYWVAPMDANYRRDGPGKSPMGMDLVPVYEEALSANDAGPGTISVAPEVINTLGVRTGKVEYKVLQSQIRTVGYVKFDEHKLMHIHPRVSGWVEALFVKAAGDPVKKGEPLYSLYSPELVNAQEELLLALNSGDARLVRATVERMRALQIPRTFINTLKQSKNIQQTVTFFAPQNGVVDNLNIREGYYVQPGTTLFSIGTLDEVWVEAEIFERQASLVKQGQEVSMKLDYMPGKRWSGRVDYIYPTLDNTTRTLRARVRINNEEHLLKPNMFAEVTIHSHNDEQVLVIPKEALIRTGNQDRVVLSLGQGAFKSIEVKAGREDQYHIEILEGLAVDEEVVSSAQFLLDSESAKTSDFMRMHHAADEPESVWVAGIVEGNTPEEKLLMVNHDPIDAWGMPGMTMQFLVNDSVDMQGLTVGTHMHMEIRKSDSGMFEIVGTHIMSFGDTDDTESSKAPVDHSKMDHTEHQHTESHEG